MIDLFDKPINDWDSVAKRAFDIFFSLFGIVVFSPIIIATAIAIKLESKGPVIFKQQRHGFNNEIIEVWKFRSMYTEMCDPRRAMPWSRMIRALRASGVSSARHRSTNCRNSSIP